MTDPETSARSTAVMKPAVIIGVFLAAYATGIWWLIKWATTPQPPVELLDGAE